MKKTLILSILLLSMISVFAQRQSECLDRGLVAMPKSSSQIYVSWRLPPTPTVPDTTFITVDGDGRDEFVEISYVIDDDGSLLYKVDNVAHGDRHCLADIDPDRPGLEQFFIQQTNIMGMGLYDATNGEMIKGLYLSALGDVGRGICGAFDPTTRGMQFWSTMNSSAVYDCKGNLTGATGTFPAEALWWGPDLARWEINGIGSEGYNLAFHKYNPAGKNFARDLPNLYNEDNADTEPITSRLLTADAPFSGAISSATGAKKWSAPAATVQAL